MKKNILWIALAMLSGNMLQASNATTSTPYEMTHGPRGCAAQGGHPDDRNQICIKCVRKGAVYNVKDNTCK